MNSNLPIRKELPHFVREIIDSPENFQIEGSLEQRENYSASLAWMKREIIDLLQKHVYLAAWEDDLKKREQFLKTR